MKIYNETWSIKEVSQEKLQEISGTKELLHYGLCIDEANTIYLLDDVCKIRKRKILIHEVSHAVFSVFSHYDSSVRQTEESTCNFVAGHLDEIHRVVKEYFKK